MIDQAIHAIAQFGTAGLMGTLWVWERTMTRRRETQLTATHEKLMAERLQLRELMRTVHRNTRAIERFDKTQAKLNDTLERMKHDLQHPTT